ncbi:hypothetical protein [Bacillus sp. CECT 9360]|nr:hypothetical protein [Bacillus sp. CECT 9360]CAH0347408.1 hypothetical protein BCI9360_03804 [Bacillus sp. CECT 9360]
MESGHTIMVSWENAAEEGISSPRSKKEFRAPALAYKEMEVIDGGSFFLI